MDLSANDVEPPSSDKKNGKESELQSEQGSGDIYAEEGVHVAKASAAATAAVRKTLMTSRNCCSSCTRKMIRTWRSCGC